ncbi:MAG: hypothetical protein HXY26_02685 [Hydrogenophilaceae bacterium]|nr:hypothetical protein [Hydrogenophilaceae bacterium]
MSSVPCVIYRDALNQARQAYNDNRADYAQALQDAASARNRLYQATQANPGDPDYDLYQEIRGWADTMYGLAQAAQIPATPQQYQNAPGRIPGYASSLFSAVVKRENLQAAEPGLLQALAQAQQAYDACMQQWQQNNPEAAPAGGNEEPAPAEGGEEPTPPEGGEAPAPAEEGAAVGGYASALCLAPRTGHGHEGEPCHIRLGKDGACQYHGYRRDTSNIA